MAGTDATARPLTTPPVRHALAVVSKLAPIGIFLLLWEAASGTVVPVSALPPVSVIWTEAVKLWVSEGSTLQPFLLATIIRSLVGILIATAIGVPLGLAMSRSDFLRNQLEPVIRITYPSPKSPLIPILIFWLGIGDLSRIVLAVIGSLLPILLSTLNGVDTVQRELLWSARSMGVGRFEETYKVMLPAILPTVLTGIRIGMIFSFIIVISSEMILARTGIGVLIVQFGEYGQYARVFAAVFWAVLVVAGADRLYLAATRRLLSWSDQEVGGV